MARLRSGLGKILDNWFLIGILVAIFSAKWNPSLGATHGPLRPEITVKIGCVTLIFFISGLSIKLDEFKSAILKVRKSETLLYCNSSNLKIISLALFLPVEDSFLHSDFHPLLRPAAHTHHFSSDSKLY